MATSKGELTQVAARKGLGMPSFRQTHTETGYTSELYLGKQIYYSESTSHASGAQADEDAAHAALRCLRLEDDNVSTDVAAQLCLSLQQLNLVRSRSLDATDGHSTSTTPTSKAAQRASNMFDSQGSLSRNNKAKCNALLSEVGSLPATYSMSSKPSGSLDIRFQAMAFFHLKYVAKSGEGVAGKKPAEQKAAEQALNLLQIPMRNQSAKSSFNEWAQTERVQVPRYYVYNVEQVPAVFCAVVYNERLPEKNVSFALKGDVCASAREAEESAAEQVIDLINGLHLTGPLNQQCSSAAVKCSSKPASPVSVVRLPNRTDDSENCFDILCRHCQKLGVPVPTALIRPSPSGYDECIVKISYKFYEKPQRLHTTKKEAEKAVAQYALMVAFPSPMTPEAVDSKNRLQEICQKRLAPALPHYETVQPDGVKLFTSTVTVQLEFAYTCGTKYKTAKHMTAKMILERLHIDI